MMEEVRVPVHSSNLLKDGKTFHQKLQEATDELEKLFNLGQRKKMSVEDYDWNYGHWRDAILSALGPIDRRVPRYLLNEETKETPDPVLVSTLTRVFKFSIASDIYTSQRLDELTPPQLWAKFDKIMGQHLDKDHLAKAEALKIIADPSIPKDKKFERLKLLEFCSADSEMELCKKLTLISGDPVISLAYDILCREFCTVSFTKLHQLYNVINSCSTATMAGACGKCQGKGHFYDVCNLDQWYTSTGEVLPMPVENLLDLSER